MTYLPNGYSTFQMVVANNGRKRTANHWLEMYQGKQKEHTLAIMRSRYENTDQIPITFSNVTKAITDMRATIYRKPAQRHFNGMDQQLGEAIYKEMGADQKLQYASKMAKLMKVVALKPTWINDEAKLRLDVLTPNILDADGSDPLKPLQYVITDQAADPRETVYHDWTADYYRRFDYRGKIIETVKNPYDALHFVPCHDEMPTDGFFPCDGEELINLNERINELLTNINYTARYQSHGIPVVHGVKPEHFNQVFEQMAGMEVGPDKLIILPEGATMEIIHPNAPIEEVSELINKEIKQGYATAQLPADILDTSKTPQSGSSKRYERSHMVEARAADEPYWESYERELFEVVKLVWNHHQTDSSKKIPEDATLSVDFFDFADLLSHEERLELAIKKRDEAGIWDRRRVLMDLEPNQFDTDEKALEEIARVDSFEQTTPYNIGE